MANKHGNGLEAKLDKFVERMDGYIHHNEKEKDRIWHAVSKMNQRMEKYDQQFAEWQKRAEKYDQQIEKHDRQFVEILKRNDRTLAEIQHLRHEFRRWIREQ